VFKFLKKIVGSIFKKEESLEDEFLIEDFQISKDKINQISYEDEFE